MLVLRIMFLLILEIRICVDKVMICGFLGVILVRFADKIKFHIFFRCFDKFC